MLRLVCGCQRSLLNSNAYRGSPMHIVFIPIQDFESILTCQVLSEIKPKLSNPKQLNFVNFCCCPTVAKWNLAKVQLPGQRPGISRFGRQVLSRHPAGQAILQPRVEQVNLLCGTAAQSQNALQQQMKAASAAASQYKQQAQETGRDFDSFKQQVCVYGTSDSHSCMCIEETALSVCCHPSMPCFGHPDT